ncbi:MAG TPA: M67 family metallopeptidase [Phycisphaerae bacterium]|nr:M67 family metallopeptidase [Phycisphaerae bacterium]
MIIKISDVHLPPQAAAIISRHVQKDFPREACGFLIGESRDFLLPSRRIIAVIPAKNVVSSDPAKAYAIDSHEWLRLERQLQEKNLAILGIYHSHPDDSTLPSNEDSKYAAAWPELIYIIAAVAADGYKQMCAWLYDPDSAAWQSIKIIGR